MDNLKILSLNTAGSFFDRKKEHKKAQSVYKKALILTNKN